MWPVVAASLIGVCIGFLGGLTFAWLITMKSIKRGTPGETYTWEPMHPPDLKVLP
jgi:hypothetical protein